MCQQSTVEEVVNELADDGALTDVDEKALTHEEIADRYERILIHGAGALLLAKSLSKLANSSIHFKENGLERSADIRDGVVTFFSGDATRGV